MRLHAPIQPCLWLGHQAEQAANCYVDVFPDSRITHVAHYTEAGRSIITGTGRARAATPPCASAAG
jgi:predicted 3-demethylubiquinone-9 3-methyltransferase (glyoxalase superfamily)